MAHQLTESQRQFLELFVSREALRFGEFTLKSGRTSPYFINSGRFCTGADLQPLGQAYASVIAAHFPEVDLIFGPAYKGIPLALATAQALEQQLGKEISWTFDRKEAKQHGDGGSFVGAPLSDGTRVVVVDDVITAGTALRESLTMLGQHPVKVLGAVVSIDREEPGPSGQPATTEIATTFGLPVHSVLSIRQAVAHLTENDVNGTRYLSQAQAEAIQQHLSRLS